MEEPKKDDIEEGQKQSELETKDDSEDTQEQWSELATKVALGTLSQQNMMHYNHSQGK